MSSQKWVAQLISITLGLFLWGGCTAPANTPSAPSPLAATPNAGAAAPTARHPATPAAPSQQLAYVSAGRLFLATENGADTRQVDECLDEVWCYFYHLSWSPDGTNLVYVKATLPYTWTTASTSLMMAGDEGTPRAVVDRSAALDTLFPPIWSPDGQRLAYAMSTTEYLPGPETTRTDETLLRVTGARQRMELWVIPAPFIDNGQKVGDIYVTAGCGGAGSNPSEILYWMERLGTFPQAPPGPRLAWTATDLLLYSSTCLGTGIGRLDVTTGQELPPLDEANLLAFTVDLPRQRWAAMSQRNEIALGGLNQTAFTLLRPAGIPDTAPLTGMLLTGTVQLGGVFFGPTSGRLYYTTRQLLTTKVIDDLTYLGRFEFMPLGFDFYRTTLFVAEHADLAQAQPLLQSDDYAYASLTETASGDLLFVRITNGQALYEAMHAGQPIEALDQVWPKPQIMRLAAASSAPEVWLDNAGQLALAPPRDRR